ncbi:MAG: helix-turn-helix domain-containing protein, partial [Alphaproteobacteria bacterium]|nr:helix-turn-helix domain-containing protein [Alphaproteobacteria bacterium]
MAYAETPETLGQHLRRRRIQAGLLQREVAVQLGAGVYTYLLWERDRTMPRSGYYPAIFDFLGYDPFPAARSLAEEIRAKRRQLGL